MMAEVAPMAVAAAVVQMQEERTKYANDPRADDRQHPSVATAAGAQTREQRTKHANDPRANDCQNPSPRRSDNNQQSLAESSTHVGRSSQLSTPSRQRSDSRVS